MIKQQLDLKVADDFCSRALAVYATIRVDDVTKIWSHNIPKGDMERTLADDAKNQYNNGLRAVRNKLGAHYQSPDEKADLFGSNKIFKSIDYANTTCIIDTLLDVESKIEGKTIVCNGFKDYNDIRKVKEALELLYSDDTAHLTNGALDLFGMNKGGVLMTTGAQVKGQYLRSIELLVGVADYLLNNDYAEEEVGRMFKRLYVCMVYNYHDNLITRKDIGPKAEQYEEGFDLLFPTLISPNDNKKELQEVFDKFEKKYQVEDAIKKYRKVRDHACAHFDEDSTADVINKELDSLDIKQLGTAYNNMLNLFNYVCNNVFCLKPLTLPARVPLYGMQMETIEDNENFYGELLSLEFPEEMSCTEILRIIRKRGERAEEAKEEMTKKLISHDVSVYQEMIGLIAERLKEPTIPNEELSAILNALNQAKRGYPDRVQRSLFEMIEDDDIFKNCNGHLLWLLSGICREDKDIDVRKVLDFIIVQGKPIPTSLSLLALLHLIVVKNHSVFADENKAHDVDKAFSDYCSAVTHPTEKLLIMMVLGQHWFWDQEYAHYRSYETKYTSFFIQEAEIALDDYMKFIKCKDADEINLCKQYLKRNLYLLVLYRLAFYEESRKQKPNLFMEAWKHNCFIRTREYLYEAFGVGLLTELSGDKELAKSIFETLLRDNPVNDDAIRTLEEFYERNLEMK